MEERIAKKAKDYSGISDAEAAMRQARNAISIFR
jgi:hypothetical protein